MMQQTLKSAIEQALKNFSQVSTSDGIKHLFETLGYSTQREVPLDNQTPNEVLEVFAWENFREDKGLLEEWESVNCLFQVTEDEITQNGQGTLFKPSFDTDYLKSYIFLGLTLQRPAYSRSDLAKITREINRQSDIPIMVLFRYGNYVTLSIINRRPNKLDRDKDVLEKITLIKDININSPHRAHIEILADLALTSLPDIQNFDQLHTAWQKVLNTSELNNKFFQEVSHWYFWATQTVTFPDGGEADESLRNATSVIRLITRLIFVWFLKEKGLVPDALFDENQLKNFLNPLESEESTYYKAILQNLFFATLNTEMNTDEKPDNRKFRGKNQQKGGRDGHYGIANVYRYQDYFTNVDEFLGLCSHIPFLNGGLFECLDRDKDDASAPSPKGKEKTKIRIDGFSDREDNVLNVPNILFFGEATDVDLNKAYGTKNKKYKVQGLINIFNRYKFTIDENTPIEEEIALDPELLGKVFENLLAEYNPETETTARKQTGSFYTPREIVNYMVDESLIAYLQNSLPVTQASSLLKNQDDSEIDISNNQDDCVTIRRRFLPHWQQNGATYFVTFRLADSLPQIKLQLLQQEKEEWQKKHPQPLSETEKAEYHRLFSQRVDKWLDAGMGECYLKDPQLAKIVADALAYFDGDRYHLGEWVVMPNHVHVIVTPLGNHKLSEITHSWKSFTANKINKYLNRRGQLWQKESYDQIVRSPQHLERVQTYIANHAPKVDNQDDCVTRLTHLLSYSDDSHQFNDDEVDCLINAIDNLKIIDIACGSGAFPMVILRKLVFILGKLDPHNIKWKQQQKEKAIAPVLNDIQVAKQISYEQAREEAIQKLQERLAEIEYEFENNEMDYPRKLFLIENCIFGVDIQPIAVQISKLRFFISLIVDQRVNNNQPNRGILPLPNLETKFVAANSLIGLETQLSLRSPEVIQKEEELKQVRQQHFQARTPKTKKKCREKDNILRQEISHLLKATGLETATADTLARWNPYDLNTCSDFFDPNWMFGVDAFDICIGNPPYVRADSGEEHLKLRQKIIDSKRYETLWEKWDLYIPFIELGYQLLNPNGITTMIVSDAYCHAKYAQKSQNYFLKNSKIIKLDFLSKIKVFEAGVYNIVYFYQKADGGKNKPERRVHDPEFGVIELLPTDEQKNLDSRVFFPEDKKTNSTFDSCITIELSNICYLSVGMVVNSNEKLAKGAFTLGDLISETRDEIHLKLFVEGKHIQKWIAQNYKWIEWGTDRAPKLFRRPTFPELYNVNEKIFIMRITGKGIYACFDENQTLCNQTVIVCLPWDKLSGVRNQAIKKVARYGDEKPKREDLPNRSNLEKISIKFLSKYILAIMNSKVAYEFLQTNRRSNTDLYPDDWKKLPIPDVTLEQQQPIVKLVDQILEIKRQKPKADTRELERKIDEIVYKLYDLTEEEIQIIEESGKR